MITNPVLSAADVTDQPGITSDYAHSIPAAISLLKSFSKVHPNALHVLRYLEGKAEREKRRRAEASPNDGYKHKIPTHLPPSIFAELRAKREEEKFSSVPLNQNETGHGQRRLWNRRWSMWSKPTWKRLTKSTNLPNDGHEENKEEKEEDNTPITARPSQQLEASKAKQTEATTSDIDARNEHETRGSLCVDSAKTHPTQPAPYNLRLRRSSRQLLDPFSLPSPKEPEYSEDAQDAAKGRHTPDHFCASPDPKPRKFTKVRHHRLGRGSTMPLHPTPFAAKPSNKDFESFEASTSDQSDCESPLERLQRAESIGSIKPQSGRSTSFTPEKAIDSDVETDLERFHDFGVDTDTEPEGRPATRCLVYDAFDGMPHPFWGTESEQSSWVSLPNQWKLEPECKVLQMLKLFKHDSRPPSSSSLLIRHYKPFLKFGIFPERLFELWGCDKKAPPSYYYNELKRRASLCNLEQYPFSLPSHPPSSQHRARQTTTAVSPEAASLTKNKEESLTTQKKDDPQSVTHNGTASSESFEKTLHQRIRQAADAFRESTKMSLYNDEEREQLLHSEYRRMTDIKLSCPVDPTWRNVYYSRVRLMWKPQKPSLSYLVNRLQTYDLEDARNAALKEARKKRVAWHLPFSDTEDEAHSYRKSFLGLNQETVTPKPHDGKTTSHNPKSEQDASDQNTHPQLPARRAMHDMAVGWDMGDRGDRVSWSAENIDSVITRRCPFAWIRLEKKQQALLFNYSGKRRTPLRFHLSRKSLRRSRNPLDHATLLSKLPEGAGVSSGSSSLGGVVDQGPLVNLNYMGLKSIPKNALLLAYKKLLDARVLNPAIWEKRRQRLESRANVLSLNQRPPLKIRRGRRAVNCSSKIAGEGKQWLMFHQTRSSIAEHNLNFLAPPPVPVPASVCFPSGELTRELTNHRHYLKGHNKYLPWPTFIPTLFRGPAQYEDLQEALLHAMWAAYKTSEHRIQFSATTSSADAMPLLSSARPSSKLRLWISGYMIPHDDKRFRCGDDAWFGSEGIMALGVCDGVGEMSDTHWRAAGFDCRQFGENVLQEAKSHIQSLRDKNEVTVGTRNRMILPEGRQRRENVWKTEEFEVNPASDTPSRMALDAMISAYYTRRSSWGAITCIIGCLNETGTRIGFANIGDSRAVILRRLPYSTGPLDIVGATNPEQHDWNLPVQLARLPDQRHVQMMRHDERFKTLVESLDACRATGQAAHDAPESATLYDFDLQEGDLILVATDGLWDNLFDGELAALCGVALSPLESQLITDTPFLSTAPRDIAKGLCLAAYWKSLQDHVETPFSQTVRRHGGMGFQRGGKTDDITVVAAWVVAESYANTPDLLESCRAQYAEWKKKIEGSLARSTLEPGKTPKRGPEDKQNGLPQ